MRNLVAFPALTAILFALLEQRSNALNSLAQTTKQCRAPVAPNSNTRLSVATAEPEVSSLKASFTDNDDIDVDGVEFPPPLSSMDRTKRAATFYSTVVPIIANYAGLIANLKVQELMGTERFTEAEIEKLWSDQHEDGAKKVCDVTTKLKGFYVKTAQIISTRQDLFPKQYTDALNGFTDNLDPMDASLAKAVVAKELLHKDEKFTDVFSEFDDVPLGSASVAQVHRAVLTEKYGGREVAIKIQRPSIESKLLGDVANLKAVSKALREYLPLDYYTVFAELETQLADEFDFVAEAVSMDRIYQSLTRSPDGTEVTESPVVLPRPVPGLISKRVLVMDYLKGVPLSRAREEMEKRGIDPESPESKLFGRNLLKALTYSFGRNILETGFFHADPHPGNIFVLENGDIGLIDFGQVKQISGRSRETLAKVMIALDERVGDERPEDLEKIGNLALELGVTLNDDAQDEAAAAVAMWLFDGATEVLPGGYDMGELSPNSPVKELESFPQDLVLVGRSSILIKGISNRLNIPWSLAKEWAPIARDVLDINSGKKQAASSPTDDRVRFKSVLRALKKWSKGRTKKIATKLPSPVRSRLAAYLVRREERISRKKLMGSKEQ
mmetsp:Transcript_276/g.696  ORF Transcript_276/g.696 Transcript_276/m.696 type:complete len:613 (-) Transcript_276:264-2102(-)